MNPILRFILQYQLVLFTTAILPILSIAELFHPHSWVMRKEVQQGKYSFKALSGYYLISHHLSNLIISMIIAGVMFFENLTHLSRVRCSWVGFLFLYNLFSILGFYSMVMWTMIFLWRASNMYTLFVMLGLQALGVITNVGFLLQTEKNTVFYSFLGGLQIMSIHHIQTNVFYTALQEYCPLFSPITPINPINPVNPVNPITPGSPGSPEWSLTYLNLFSFRFHEWIVFQYLLCPVGIGILTVCAMGIMKMMKIMKIAAT
jgi:hypothetical protein